MKNFCFHYVQQFISLCIKTNKENIDMLQKLLKLTILDSRDKVDEV